MEMNCISLERNFKAISLDIHTVMLGCVMEGISEFFLFLESALKALFGVKKC